MSHVRVCFQYHPDRVRGDSSLDAESALKTFLEIDAAWRILKDKESRRQYDLKLRGRWPTDRCDLCHNFLGASLDSPVLNRSVLLYATNWSKMKCSVETHLPELIVLYKVTV